MATTVADLIQETRRLLLGMHRAEWNKLASDVTTGTTTWTFSYPLSGIAAGSYLAIEDELVYVWSVDKTAGTAAVQRAMLGTTAAAHTASSTMVEVNPRFPQFAIRAALQAETRSWLPRLWAPTTVALSVGSGSRSVDLAGVDSEFVRICDVVRSPKTGSDSYYSIPARVLRDQDLGAFPSGNALVLDQPTEKALTLSVTYARPYQTDVWTDATDLVNDVLMPPEVHDIPPMGAAWRLVSSREIKHTFTEGQGETRDAQEVPAGATLRAAAGIKMLRDERIAQEASMLQHRWPVRIRG